jgi:hypothetical protein
MVCNTFLRNGWSIVRSASLAKGGTLKKRPSLHLREVLTRSNKVNPQTLQTALILEGLHLGMTASSSLPPFIAIVILIISSKKICPDTRNHFHILGDA